MKEAERESLTNEKSKDMDAIKRTVAASPMDMLKGVAKGVVDLATGGVIDPKERIAICKKCPSFVDDRYCEHCGCYMEAKAMIKNATCPINAWNKQES